MEQFSSTAAKAEAHESVGSFRSSEKLCVQVVASGDVAGMSSVWNLWKLHVAERAGFLKYVPSWLLFESRLGHQLS